MKHYSKITYRQDIMLADIKVMREDIDYLREEIKQLKKRVYDIETGDV
jgi:polyhydroxyalkanoate synthesis regulator phasin